MPAAEASEADLEPVEPVEQGSAVGREKPEPATRGSSVRKSNTSGIRSSGHEEFSEAEERQPWEEVPETNEALPSFADELEARDAAHDSDAPFTMEVVEPVEVKPSKPVRDPPRRSAPANPPRRAATEKSASAAIPSDDDDVFSAIVSQPTKPAAKPTEKAKPVAGRTPAKSTKKRAGDNTRIVWIIAGSIAAVFLIAIGIMAATGAFNSTPVAVQPPPITAAGPPMLVVDWPKEERDSSLLILDDTFIRVGDQAGPLEYKLSPGEHRLRLRRVGSAPIDISIPPQKDGQRFAYKPTWKPGTPDDERAIRALIDDQQSDVATPSKKADRPVADSIRELKKWQIDLDDAKKEAQKEKKDILLVFFGADRRDWCIKLARDVLLKPDFRKFADPKFTFVLFEAKAQTFDEGSPAAKLAAGYHITEFPMMVLADAEGLPYALQDYMDPQRANYISSLQDALKLRQGRDEVLTPTTKGTDAEKLAAAEKFVDWLEKNHMVRLYESKLKEWTALADRVDPKNEKGLSDKFFLASWLAHLREVKDKEPAQVLPVADELDQFRKTHKFKDTNKAAELFIDVARLFAMKRDDATAGRFLQGAADCEPTDPRLRSFLDRVAGAANAPISSGSGFIIADGGFILTNNHVVEGEGHLWVRIVGEEKEIRASVVATDPKHDIALIKLDTMPKTALKPIPLSSKTPGPGADIAVLGYPLGDVLGGGLKLTKGAISAPPDKGREGMYLLDCKVNHGNSGGPMCDKHGQVVGLVSAKTTVGGDTDSYGMALPPNTMADFVKAHLPGFQTAPANPKSFSEWDEFYEVIKPSVVMILKRAS